MASFAYGQSKKVHINITLIISRMPRIPKFIIFGLMSILSAVTAGVMAYSAYIQIGYSIKNHLITDVLYWPKTPLFVVEFISLLALTVVLIFDTIMIFAALKDDDVAAEVVSTWSD
jgi:TRAP-type C4-dicarboxylate transport system permease small subunit